MTDEEFEQARAQARANVEQYRREHGIDRYKPSGDADTGSLTHDEEEELRWRHR